AATPDQPIAFSVTIASLADNGTPTGTVTFLDGSTVLGTAPVNDAGQATLTIAAFSVGPHTITAVFSGDANHAPSTSTVASLFISTAPTPENGLAAASVQGPTVTGLKRFGFHAQSTYLVLSFSGSLDVAAAQSVSNYTIVGPLNRQG